MGIDCGDTGHGVADIEDLVEGQHVAPQVTELLRALPKIDGAFQVAARQVGCCNHRHDTW